MIVSDSGLNKFTFRNGSDFSIIKTFDIGKGHLLCGLCYPEQKEVVLGISYNLVVINYEQMKITNSIETK